MVVQLLANGDVSLTARILAGRKDAGGNPIPATVTITVSKTKSGVRYADMENNAAAAAAVLLWEAYRAEEGM